MVRVFYEPPPFGPGTDLNRTAYGVHGGGSFRTLVERASKMKPMYAVGIPVVASVLLCYLPLSKHYLSTFDVTFDRAKMVDRLTFFSHFCFVSYFTSVGLPLPFSMEPEYQAAQRAYMRYHK